MVAQHFNLSQICYGAKATLLLLVFTEGVQYPTSLWLKAYFCRWHYCICICRSFTFRGRNFGRRIFKYKCDLLRFASCNITSICFEFNTEQKHILFRLDVVVAAPGSVHLFGEGRWLKGVSVIPKLLSCHVILVSPHPARLGPSLTHFWIWIIWLFCNRSQIWLS